MQRNVARILEILDRAGVTATFFVLGWVAERYPGVVADIVSAGHEIGAHGYDHQLIQAQSVAQFRADVAACLAALKAAGAPAAKGYRAPSYSVTKRTIWALDVLVELGFRYDSSVYPIGFHDRYGIPGAPRRPYLVQPELAEFPLPVIDVAGAAVPVATGAYFRLVPYSMTRLAIERLNRSGLPVTVNLHPWELDPDQPHVSLPWTLGFRHYTNLSRTEERLRRLVDEFEFRELAAGLPAVYASRAVA